MFTLSRVKDKLWHLEFDRQYDMAMTFLRYSEYYEGQNHQGKKVELIDLIEKFSKNGNFTYSKDWSGFNIPAKYVFELHDQGISDLNRYDEFMLSIFKIIRSKEDSDNFYVIGTSKEDPEQANTFNHELAHGLFYVDEKYKNKAIKLVNNLPEKIKKKIFAIFNKWGYHEDVYIDEANAYLATGLVDNLDVPEIQEHQGAFIKLFKKHSIKMRKRVKNIAL